MTINRGQEFRVSSDLEKNDDKNFYGLGWSVHYVSGKYIFRYVIALQGGGEAEMEISKEDYHLARNSEIDDYYILSKYGENSAYRIKWTPARVWQETIM